MTDQPKPSKLKCFLKGFFIFLKWVFVLILTILLIAGLYFHAPWKVLTLLAIVLSAITILPKRFRKYFYITTACIAIALTIWVFLPEDNTAWKPYTCQKEITALNEKYKIPDDQNAAIIYNKILDNFDEDELSFDFKDYKTGTKLQTSPWLASDYPDLAEWIAGHEKTIAVLSDAASYDNCYFSYEQESDILEDIMPRIGKMRSCSRLLLLAAQNDIAQGRTVEALDKCKITMVMADHMYQYPSLIEILVSIAIEAQAYSFLQEFAMDSDLAESDMRAIEKIISVREHDWQEIWPITVDIEKLLYYRFLYAMYEVNEQDKIRFTRDPLSFLSPEVLALLGEQDEPAYWTERRNRLSAFLSWFYLPADPAKASAGLEQMFKRYHEMTEEDWQSGPREFSFKSVKLSYPYVLELFQYISEPAIYEIHSMHSRIISDKNATSIILALKKHYDKKGSWPKDLGQLNIPSEMLVDPINNDSYVYKLTKEEYVFYSTGLNKIDDDGDRYGKNDDGERKDDHRFWPPKSRLREQEETNDGMPMPAMPLPPGMDPNMMKMMRMPGMPDMPMPGMTNTE